MDSATATLTYPLAPLNSLPQQNLEPREHPVEGLSPWGRSAPASFTEDSDTDLLLPNVGNQPGLCDLEVSSNILALTRSPVTVKKSTRESSEYVEQRSRLLEQQAAITASRRGTPCAEMDPPVILKPPNSVFWMKLISARWLLIQMKELSIELWDVLEPDVKKPVITCSAISGAIDGAVIELDGNPHCVKLHVSTSSYVTFTLLLSLHIHCSCETFTPEIASRETTRGFSGIMDQRGSLFAFSRSIESPAMGFIKDAAQGRGVQLRRSVVEAVYTSDSSSEPNPEATADDIAYELNHEVLDILIREDVVAVARNNALDLYSTPKVISLLQGQSNHITISDIPPHQSLVYPGIDWPLYRASILRQPNSSLAASSDAIILVSTDFDGCYGVVATPLRSSDTPGSPSSAGALFSGEILMNIAQPSPKAFHVVWGPSGKRFASLSDTFLSVSFTVKGPTTPDRYLESPQNALAIWVIPGRLSDIPVAMDFDEKTGICVAAMASGRIWVMDSTTYSNCRKPKYPLSKGLASESPEIAKNLSNPNPEPFRWPLTMPLPAPFGIQLRSDKPREIAPGWSDEVDKYFPYKNQDQYYGSTPWLIQEVAHIPIRHVYSKRDGISSKSNSTKQETWAKTVLFTTDAVDPFSFSRGYSEVIDVRPIPGASDEDRRFWLLEVTGRMEWGLYKLKPLESVEAIVEHLLKPGAHIEQLCEHRPLRDWPIDQEKLDQLGRWMDRYFRNYGRPGEMLLH